MRFYLDCENHLPIVCAYSNFAVVDIAVFSFADTSAVAGAGANDFPDVF